MSDPQTEHARRPMSERARFWNRLAYKLVPTLEMGFFAFAAYAVLYHTTLLYMYQELGLTDTAIALWVAHMVTMIFALASFGRTYLSIMFNTALVPLSRRGVDARKRRESTLQGPDELPFDPNCPSLVDYHGRDVYVCRSSGYPEYCGYCLSWKPDRAHHSTELDRCVYKMDHTCAWVGGVVSETSFKFFFQFTYYVSAHLVTCIATGIHTLRLQNSEPGFRNVDAVSVVLIALSVFGLLLAGGICLFSLHLILHNMTHVDCMQSTQKVFKLALRVPLGTPSTDQYRVVTFPRPPRSRLHSGTRPTRRGDHGRSDQRLAHSDRDGAGQRHQHPLPDQSGCRVEGRGRDGHDQPHEHPNHDTVCHWLESQSPGPNSARGEADGVRRPHAGHHEAGQPLGRPGRDGAFGLADEHSVADSRADDDDHNPFAQHAFAVVHTQVGENPWDLGRFRNWQEVMGYNAVDWLLPFRLSPCACHTNPATLYPTGPLVQELRERFKLPAYR